MDERKFNIAGLLGFMLSGLCFAALGLESGDPLALAGSIIWIVACIIWILPLLFAPKRQTKI
jgi:uncharacterized membrane protein YhhN